MGRIIGRGGETIRALQQASQAHIVVDQNYPEGQPRRVNISGRQDAVDRAAKMVQELISGEPGSAQSIIQKVPLSASFDHVVPTHERFTDGAIPDLTCQLSVGLLALCPSAVHTLLCACLA